MPLPRSVALMTLFLTACGGGEPSPVPQAATPAAAPPAPPAPAMVQDVLTRGTIRMLPSPMFRSCDVSVLTPLVDSTGDRIPSLYRATRSNDQDGMYVEGRVAGGVVGKVILRSIELVTQSGDAWSCDRPAPTWRFRATGRNPAWSVTVTSIGITYEMPDSAVKISFPAGAPQDTATFIRFTGSTLEDGGHSIHLLLEPGGCNIGSTGTWASMHSQLVLDGKPANGCASRGTQP